MNFAILRTSPGIIVWAVKSLSGVPGKVFRVLHKSTATGCGFVPISGTHMNYCYMKKKISRKKKEELRRKKKDKNYTLLEADCCSVHKNSKVDLRITEKKKLKS